MSSVRVKNSILRRKNGKRKSTVVVHIEKIKQKNLIVLLPWTLPIKVMEQIRLNVFRKHNANRWGIIVARMLEVGYKVTAQQCKTK